MRSVVSKESQLFVEYAPLSAKMELLSVEADSSQSLSSHYQFLSACKYRNLCQNKLKIEHKQCSRETVTRIASKFIFQQRNFLNILLKAHHHVEPLHPGVVCRN